MDVDIGFRRFSVLYMDILIYALVALHILCIIVSSVLTPIIVTDGLMSVL